MPTLDELKAELAKDFGKTTCWQWVCKEWNCVTEEEQIIAAEEVLAMPRMDSVGAAHIYWCKIHGAESGNINELLKKE